MRRQVSRSLVCRTAIRLLVDVVCVPPYCIGLANIATEDMASRWPHLVGPAVVVQHFAIGEIAPLNQSRTIFRFRTLPLERQLRWCVATAEEVELNRIGVL